MPREGYQVRRVARGSLRRVCVWEQDELARAGVGRFKVAVAGCQGLVGLFSELRVHMAGVDVRLGESVTAV